MGSLMSNLAILIYIKASLSMDCMHLTCLGVAKRLIVFWIDKGPLNVRLPSSVSKKLSAITFIA